MDDATFDWEPFALLLIDVQNDFWSDRLPQQFPKFPENIAQLLKFCRSEGIEIIHLRSIFKQDQSDWMIRYRLRKQIPCLEGTPGIEVVPFARELPGEKVMIKHTFDGFLTPELFPYLQHAKKYFILTAGLITSTCVFLTTASAMQRGFLTAVVEDCCADGPSRHKSTMETYPYIFDRTKVALLPFHYDQWMANISLVGTE
jgi:ureidoacrylate peracid hydrolase